MFRTNRWAQLGAALAIGLTLPGCGGGGGGGTPQNPATVSGRVLFVSSGSPPSPKADVTISGTTVHTDDRGVFTITNVPSGRTDVTITISATGAQTLTETLPSFTGGTANDIGDIYLADAGQAYDAVVTSTIIRADTQAAVAGAKVTINGQTATTSASGAFTISGLPEGLGGSASLVVGKVVAAGFQQKDITFGRVLGAGTNAIDPIQVAVASGNVPGVPGNVVGIVTLQGLADFSAVTVTITDKSNNQVVGTYLSDNTGAYGFWVPAGTYTLTFARTGFGTKTQDVTVTSPDVVKTVNTNLVPAT